MDIDTLLAQPSRLILYEGTAVGVFDEGHLARGETSLPGGGSFDTLHISHAKFFEHVPKPEIGIYEILDGDTRYGNLRFHRANEVRHEQDGKTVTASDLYFVTGITRRYRSFRRLVGPAPLYKFVTWNTRMLDHWCALEGFEHDPTLSRGVITRTKAEARAACLARPGAQDAYDNWLEGLTIDQAKEISG